MDGLDVLLADLVEPGLVSREQVWEFTDRYRITPDEVISRMGGSP